MRFFLLKNSYIVQRKVFSVMGCCCGRGLTICNKDNVQMFRFGHQNLDNMRIAFLFIIISLLFSCSVEQVFVETDNAQSSGMTLKSVLMSTKSSDGQISAKDSVVFASKVQSDPCRLLFSRIICRDNCFVLTLSKEDARFLGIDDALYGQYEEYVSKLNEHKNLSE